MSDAIRSAAHWLAGLAVYAAIREPPFAYNMSVENPADVFKRAARDINQGLHAFSEREPKCGDNMTRLMVGAEAVRRSLPTEGWRPVLSQLDVINSAGPFKSAARAFVSNHWPQIERVASELAIEKRLSARRTIWLLGCGKRAAA